MNDKKADWIHVHYEDIEQSESPKKRGVAVRFMVSPLDVPDMMRQSVQDLPCGRQEFVMEFKYLAAKEALRHFEQDGIKIEVGKNSKRVYRMSIPLPVPSQNGGKIELKIEHVIHEWEQQGALRRAHAGVIQGVLDMLKRQDLQPAL